MTNESIAELERKHLDAAADPAEAARAYKAAVRAAELSGIAAPDTDIVVQRLSENLESSKAAFRAAAQKHLDALQGT